MKVELKYVPVSLVDYNEGQLDGVPANPRTREDSRQEKLAESIEELPEMSEARPPMVLPRDGRYIVIGGNRRLEAFRDLNREEMPVVVLPEDTPVEKLRRIVLLDNESTGETDWAAVMKNWKADELESWGIDVPGEAWVAKTMENYNGKGDEKSRLSDKYIAPPFSVLDTRQGYWRERKRQWLEIIGNTAKSREFTLSGKKSIVGSYNNGVSIFDPVLSEIIAKWFAPYDKSYIFDPMAGDVNKGLVFAELGHYFAGIELRQEQVDDNNKAITGRDNIYYVCDDGRNVLKHFAQETQDLLISCPPYFDLEVYSDNENDASNQKSYKDFIGIIEAIYSDAIKVLRRNRFAVIVVGDVRGKDGSYYGFHHDVVDIFTQNGMKLYNELILLETAGTKPIVCAKPMESRKVSKVHQNVLVFYKGDTKKIKEIFKPIEIDEDRVKEYLGENNE